MTEETGEQVAQTGSRVVRDAIDLSETPLRADSSGNGHPSASREALELSKLSAEREKIELESAELREGEGDAAKQRRKIEIEKKKTSWNYGSSATTSAMQDGHDISNLPKLLCQRAPSLLRFGLRLTASSTNATRIGPLKFRNNLFTSKIRLPQHTIRLTNQTSPSSAMPLRPF